MCISYRCLTSLSILTLQAILTAARKPRQHSRALLACPSTAEELQCTAAVGHLHSSCAKPREMLQQHRPQRARRRWDSSRPGASNRQLMGGFVTCTVALLLLCLGPAHAQVVSSWCKPDRCTASWSCVDCCSRGCWLHAVNICIVLMRASDDCLPMLQPALGGGQQPVNDQLATGAPVSQQAVQPAGQLGTQKPAVTVQNVLAASAANRLGFTDRDTLPPVSMQCHRGYHLSEHSCSFVCDGSHNDPALAQSLQLLPL